jgi:hypothetical protein
MCNRLQKEKEVDSAPHQFAALLPREAIASTARAAT